MMHVLFIVYMISEWFTSQGVSIGWIVELQELPPLNINAMASISMQYILKWYNSIYSSPDFHIPGDQTCVSLWGFILWLTLGDEYICLPIYAYDKGVKWHNWLKTGGKLVTSDPIITNFFQSEIAGILRKTLLYPRRHGLDWDILAVTVWSSPIKNSVFNRTIIGLDRSGPKVRTVLHFFH